MGAKQTKLEGNYLPDTPILNRIQRIEETNMRTNEMVRDDGDNAIFAYTEEIVDPRSPNGCRTPIQIRSEIVADQQPVTSNLTATENPLTALRRRFFKGFMYNLNDPRSPHLNRTPLDLVDLKDKTLNLDDTFADLFVESRAPLATENAVGCGMLLDPKEEKDMTNADNENISTVDIIDMNNESSILVEDETMPSTAVLNQATPLHVQQSVDPRSPSLGVNRTPLIFSDNDESGLVDSLLESLTIYNDQDVPGDSFSSNVDNKSIVYLDDDEAKESAIVENILATLSLRNTSSGSVTASPAADKTDIPSEGANLAAKLTKPTNKHLVRVALGDHKRVGPMKNRKMARALRQRVYRDIENCPTPPKQAKPGNTDDSPSIKRTPLGCVKNRNTARSRSVEMSAKSIKARLPATSFDDSFQSLSNSNENHRDFML